MFWNKKEQIEKVELTEFGFRMTIDDNITEFNWSEIDKLTGFKVDRLSVDDICLRIESDNKVRLVTEEFQGWRNFMNELLNHFQEIDKNWEVIIAKPAFEKKETELYNRNRTLGNNV